MYDLIIIGLGPAGVSAAIYAKRAGLKVLTIEKAMVGGYLNYVDRVDNYAGLFGISGPDFAYNLYETINKLEIEVVNEEVTSIIDGEEKKVITSKKEYSCKKIIIATGRVPRKLGLTNEEDLRGRGLSNCALCDGAFYKDKDVAVVGGGESALQEALYLANLCRNVYLIHRKEQFSVSGYNASKVKEKENIHLLMGRNVLSLNDNNKYLNSITLDNGEEIEVSGLFLYIGFVPITEFVSKLGITDDDGYIEVFSNYETRCKGIYAIGDTIKKDIYQISVAVGEGAIASNDVISSLINNR